MKRKLTKAALPVRQAWLRIVLPCVTRGVLPLAVFAFCMPVSARQAAASERLIPSHNSTTASQVESSVPDAPQPQPLELAASPESASDTAINLGEALQLPPKGAADARVSPNAEQAERIPQTKRIFGIIPNFRAISTDAQLPPQTVKDKLVTATEDSFDYSSAVIPALLAGFSMGTKATPEFGQGAVGYGRYFWHAAVDQTTENYMVEFVVPVLAREDTRYYTLGRGGFFKRASYAAGRVFVTRSDSGREVFNLSEVVGSGASAGLSSVYYPSRERSFGNTGKQWGLDLAIDAAADAAKEFWPDINHWLTRSKKLPPVGQR